MTDTEERPTYDVDFHAWTQTQAALLRQAECSLTNLPIDWENIAEEIESMGRSDVRELRTRLATIWEHLLKLEFSSADAQRAGWCDAARRARQGIADLLAKSPGLRALFPAQAAVAGASAAPLVIEGLADHGERDAEMAAKLPQRSYADAELLGDWFPDGRKPNR